MTIRGLVARWQTIAALAAAGLAALQIVTVMRAPNALLARAEDKEVAVKVLASDRDQRADIPLGAYIAGNGTVEPRDGVVRVSGAASGRVREVRVRIGRHVEAGEALVVLDSSRVKAGLEAEVDEANAEAAALRADAVQRGGRAEVRLATRARVRGARARLALAEIELEQRTIRAPRAGTRDRELERLSTFGPARHPRVDREREARRDEGRPSRGDRAPREGESARPPVAEGAVG